MNGLFSLFCMETILSKEIFFNDVLEMHVINERVGAGAI